MARGVVTRLRDGKRPGRDDLSKRVAAMTHDPRSLRCTPTGPMAVTRTTADEAIRTRKKRPRNRKRGTAAAPAEDSLDSRRSFRRTLLRVSEHRRVLQLATPCVYGPLPLRFVLMLARPSRTLTLVY
jgi:hypothetical protein